MNNQARKFGAPSWFGTSGTTPQPHQPNLMIMMNQRNHPTHLLSQPHPQTQSGASQFPSHLQLLVAQSQYAQAQFAKAQAQAQLQSQAQAQFQSQAAQSQTHPLFANLHNYANTNVANVANFANVTSTPPVATGSGKRGPKRPRLAADRGKKSELPEKQVPGKVASLLPESPLYTQLLGFEAQMDAKLSMSKFDIQEALRSPPHVMRTLRVYVFNTFTNHTQIIGFEKKNDEEASWSLKITGRILEDGNKDSEVAGTSQGSSPSYPKFSSFFKRIKIYLDQNLYPDDNVIIWDNALSSIQHDGFEVKRKGDKEFTARIILEMSNVPEMFMLSPQLSKLLGIEVETRPRIIAALCNYVKSRNLQIPNDPLTFMCDPSLQRVFGAEKMEFEDAVKMLAQHLSLPQPIKLEHQIKLSGNCNAETACYDIQVYVPFPPDKGISAISASLESQKQIEAYDQLISASIKKVHEHRRRRAFFLSFSQSPEEFVNAFITSKSKDLKLVDGDASHNAVKESRSRFYNQPWVDDAVIRYLNRKAAGGDAPGGS